MNEPTFLKTSLGSRDLAESLASRAEKGVPAYRRLLKEQGFHPGGPFESRPLTDKRNYVTAENFTELLSDDYQNTFTIFRSSGSSGQTYYWPQLKEAHRTTAAALRGFLEAGFAVHEKKTLAIVGLALGSWIGGEHFSWAPDDPEYIVQGRRKGVPSGPPFFSDRCPFPISLLRHLLHRPPEGRPEGVHPRVFQGSLDPFLDELNPFSLTHDLAHYGGVDALFH